MSISVAEGTARLAVADSRRWWTTATRSDAAVTVFAAVVLVAVWQLLATTVLSGKGVLASPSETLASLWTDRSLYWGATRATGWVALRGWLLGSISAVVIGAVFVQSPVLERLWFRLALVLFCLPLVAVVPILKIGFEPDRSRVLLAAMAVFFPMLVMTLLGLRAADSGSLAVVRSAGGGRWAAMRFVRWRAATPSVFAGLQLGAPAAILGGLLGEFMGADRGLGVVLVNGMSTIKPQRVWGIAVITTALAMLSHAVLGRASHRLHPWANDDTGAGAAALPMPRRWWSTIGWAVASLGVVLGAWIGFIRLLGLSSFSAKTPVDVWRSLTSDARAADDRRMLLEACRTTAAHAATGYVLGLLGAVATGIAFCRRPGIERALMPIALTLRSVPIVVVTPILILALGRGAAAVALITGIISFFPTLVNTVFGLRSTSGTLTTLMHSYDASSSQLLWRAQLPSAVPAILASARLGAPAAMLGATLAEWLATGDGLGHLVISSVAMSRYTLVWAGAAALTLMSVTVYSTVSIVERRLLTRFAPEQIA